MKNQHIDNEPRKVSQFCEEEEKYCCMAPQDQAMERACLATGLSKQTFLKIKEEPMCVDNKVYSNESSSQESQPDKSNESLLRTGGSQYKENIVHVKIEFERECNIPIKTEPADDDLNEGAAIALCVTEMKTDDVAVTNTSNSMEQQCVVKAEPDEEDIQEGPFKIPATIIEVKCEFETDKGVAIKETGISKKTTEQHGDSNEEKLPHEDNPSSKKRKSRKIRRETGEKRNECKICHKLLSGITSLKAHYRTHSGEKPYECNICNNKFKQKAHLDLHLRTHTGGKPYECNICQTRFTQKINLQRHFRSHNGEKPYECIVCLNRFTRKSALLRHKSLHLA